MNKSKFSLLFLTLLLLSVSCAHKPTAIVGATIIDGTKSEPKKDSVLIVEDGKIQQVLDRTQFTDHSKYNVVEAQGKTIIPGLISGHSHLGIIFGTTADPKNFNKENVKEQLKTYQRYGITTVVSLGTNDDSLYEIKEQVNSEKIQGPYLLGADRGIGVLTGAPPLPKAFNDVERVYRPETPEQARTFVRLMAKKGTDFIKIWVDDFLGSVPKMSEEIYKAIIDESHKNNLKTVAHLYYLEDAKKLLKANVDMIGHGIRYGKVDKETIKLLKENNVGYIATLSLDEAFYNIAAHPEWLNDPFFTTALSKDLETQFKNPEYAENMKKDKLLPLRKEALKNNQQNLKKLHDAGVLLGFGTDSGATVTRVPGFLEHRELELIVGAGISPSDAIRIATSQTAEILGLKDRGTLEVGKRADFIILSSNPLENIKNTRTIEAVYQNGKKVSDKVLN